MRRPLALNNALMLFYMVRIFSQTFKFETILLLTFRTNPDRTFIIILLALINKFTILATQEY